MIRKQAVGVQSIAAVLECTGEKPEVAKTILIIDEDGTTIVPTLDDMEEATWDVHPPSARHEQESDRTGLGREGGVPR